MVFRILHPPGKRMVPGTNFYEAEILKVYDKQRLEELFTKGILLRKHGKILIPMRNQLHSVRIDRNEQTSEDEPPVKVFKAGGSTERQVFSARMVGFGGARSRRFWGGALKADLEQAANIALALRKEFHKALKENDPVVAEAAENGEVEAPTLRPIALFKPLKIPWLEGLDERSKEWLRDCYPSLEEIKRKTRPTLGKPNEWEEATWPQLIEEEKYRVAIKKLSPREATKDSQILKRIIKKQGVLAYEIGTNQRIGNQTGDFKYTHQYWVDSEAIGRRIALGRHLARRKGIIFVESLRHQNVNIEGKLLDLDAARKEKNFGQAWATESQIAEKTMHGMPKAQKTYRKYMELSDKYFEGKGK